MMNGAEEKLPVRKSARRRVRTRTAFFLCLIAAAGMLLSGAAGRFITPAFRVWLGAAASVAFFALPAYLGLCEIDGDQRHLLAARRLSGAQTLWLAAAGVLAVCPVTLMTDVISSVAAIFASAAGFGASHTVQGADGSSLLLPMLLASGVIAPVCEELFFRGYLLGVLARYGMLRAALMSALLFACVHGMGLTLPVYVLLGLLLAGYALHTGSVLAAMLMHMAYNAALILLAATPLSVLFAGLTLPGCLVRLAGCAGFVYTAKRAWLARGAREGKPQCIRLTRREEALAIAALLLVLAAQVTAVLAAGGNA